jgi:predicted O-methyltransferase YrrM
MGSSLQTEPVRAVLHRLQELGERRDPAAKLRVRARERELGAKVYGWELTALYGGASLAVAPAVGDLIYMLALARRARLIVEFGASLGFSTIHLAAALRDLGGGLLITTELMADKAQAAAANLQEAGLDDLVEVRAGDALKTLRDLPPEVGLLFLDGWNDLYLPVLELVQPRLARGALVVADLSRGDPHHERYQEHMRDPAGGYVSVELPLDEGVAVSVWMP